MRPRLESAGENQAAITYASQTISDPPTRAEVQAINDGLVAVITLLNELRAALVEKGVIKDALWQSNKKQDQEVIF